MTQEEVSRPKFPSLYRNYISFVGTAIVTAATASIVLLFLLELSGGTNSPYLGIFTYIIFPSVLVFGLAVIPIGMLWEKHSRRKVAPSEIAAYPRLDLNDPRRRRLFLIFLGASFLFVFVSAFGSYRAFQHTESVEFCGTTCHTPMRPEYTAYLASPHARVRCVDCHVGEGAGWYVRSKLSGAYQLYSVTFNKYPRPIKSPVHNLRPAPDTCERCHWPEKFFGAQMKLFTHFAYDEKNTMRQTRMLINVGGGSPTTGQVTGIHWHMNIGNEVTYITTDQQRQVIPWVRIKDQHGNVTEYSNRNRPLTSEEMSIPTRRMDCVDCHNRPAHIYLPPDVAIDQSLAANRMDPSLPFLKREASAAINQTYTTTDEAVREIGSRLDNFYKQNYGQLYSTKQDAVKNAVQETQRIFQTYFFPEMNTNWQTHPNNIGHLYSSGCFRCHDGEHFSKDGRMIRNDCNICHSVLSDSANPIPAKFLNDSFKHPVDLGALATLKCTVCHKGNKAFQHPVNLGDISSFQCSECHPKK